MRLRTLFRATTKAFREIDRKHLFAFAGSLAYYYFLSLLPLLILLAGALAYVPIPHPFDQILLWMSYFGRFGSNGFLGKETSQPGTTRADRVGAERYIGSRV